MPTLIYVHDPMCSWCYAFAPTWRGIETALPGSISVERVLGGLAPDSDRPMPPDMQAHIQSTWRRIQTVVPDTEFNFEFWARNVPRRSTYPACRAVLAAKSLGPQHERPMIEKIQTAYYREARNPSDIGTLCALAQELGLDAQAFREYMLSEACQLMLEGDLRRAWELGVTGMPSLVLESNGRHARVPHDYAEPLVTLRALGVRQ
ncbi:MAG TPA: DsbA family protein [Gammaproteobacteria bacterium]